MSEIKFRCSNVGLLFTEPKTKADKEAGNLADTVKTMIQEKWLKDNFGYDEDIFTDEIMKGRLCEQDGIQLVQDVIGDGFRKSYKENINNEFLTGTPDILINNYVEDIKCSFTIKTFFKAEISKLYEWQLRGYMALTGKKKARLIYCLVETPEKILSEIKKRLFFKFDCDEENEDYINACKQIDRNHDISQIPKEQRIKVFEIEHDEEKIQLLYEKIKQARIYYKSLKLTSFQKTI
jgi:hypothetical protein